MALRNELDLFVNVLECKSYPGIVARHQNIDIVIVRQNTEGEYAMLEHEVSCQWGVDRIPSCLIVERSRSMTVSGGVPEF